MLDTLISEFTQFCNFQLGVVMQVIAVERLARGVVLTAKIYPPYTSADLPLFEADLHLAFRPSNVVVIGRAIDDATVTLAIGRAVNVNVLHNGLHNGLHNVLQAARPVQNE